MLNIIKIIGSSVRGIICIIVGMMLDTSRIRIPIIRIYIY